MSVQELTATIADIAGISKTSARTALNAVVSTVVTCIVSSGEVVIPGLGKFMVKDYAAKEGRNFRTGEPITFAASRRVRFKAAKVLRDALNPTAPAQRKRA